MSLAQWRYESQQINIIFKGKLSVGNIHTANKYLHSRHREEWQLSHVRC